MVKHTIKLALRYSDSDQMGVVYHANYFSFFEQGRTEMLKSYGIDYYQIEEKGYLFPVREVDCTYYKSIKLGENIYCDTEIMNITKVRFAFKHTLYNDQNEVKAVGHSSIISVQKPTFEIIKMDEHLPEVYKIKDEIT
jgi:acyl-CoA thioester hydrolase